MAFFTRRRGSTKVTAYYWDRKAKKQRQVPRGVTDEWDTLTDAEVRTKLDAWESGHGVEVDRARRRTVWLSDELLAHFNNYQEDALAMAEGNILPTTRTKELQSFNKHIAAYFVGVKETKNPTRWAPLIPEFRVWLTAQGFKPATVKKTLFLLRRFGYYLAESGVLPSPWLVRIPKRNRAATTPLPKPIKPAEILAASRAMESTQALTILLGYFASLRPGETYALEKGDFVTGEPAKSESKTHARLKKHKLGSGLSVRVSKARKSGQLKALPKTHYSHGTVNIWDPKAAKEIARLVRNLPDGPLFSLSRDRLNRIYAEKIQPVLGVKAHDLRRASALWLGRTVGIDPMLLQDHMRHAEIETTMLYTRRPEGNEDEVAKQNWDDVG